jgi:hypothetical protein
LEARTSTALSQVILTVVLNFHRECLDSGSEVVTHLKQFKSLVSGLHMLGLLVKIHKHKSG